MRVLSSEGNNGFKNTENGIYKYLWHNSDTPGMVLGAEDTAGAQTSWP